MKPLSFFLTKVSDYRRKQGLRIQMPDFLVMVILGNISGFHSLQALARFFKNNEDYFIELYGLKHGVPGYTQTRTILQNIDFNSLSDSFYKWASQFLTDTDKWLNIDGKAIRSTVTNYNDKYQDFQSLVSVFATEKGIGIGAVKYRNKKVSEIVAARDLIKQLKIQGMTITFDALHCQKKQQK